MKLKTLFLHGDALEILSKAPDESVDLVIIDPPYPSLEKHRAVGTTTRLKNWIPIATFKYIRKVMKEIYRVLKKNAHFYVFVNSEALYKVRRMGIKIGFKFWKFIVWDKMAIGMGYHYRNKCEFILFFEKGKRRLNNKSMSDCIQDKRIKSKTAYPTEKPIGVVTALIEQSSNPGEIVLDAFVGSGTTCLAARACGRHSIGIDIEPTAAEHQRRKAKASDFPLKNRELSAKIASAYELLSSPSEVT